MPITNFGPGPAGVAVLRINGDIPGHVVSILKSEDVNQTHYRIEWTLDRANGVVSEFELYSESEVSQRHLHFTELLLIRSSLQRLDQTIQVSAFL